jgi:peptidoglycan/LPS O-acetylase OafA/YrhL
LKSNHTLAYRADVDGLRALAVGMVVLFHAFPTLVPGGFVGVDVFFVISGYLITSLLLKSANEGRFSVLDFYFRRVLRIFPALLLVLAAVFAFAWITLLPAEFEELGQHIAAGGWFGANLLYWSESGYFDTGTRAKPLLHLWSLGVEEQFYFVWPWLILMAVRLKRFGVAPLLVLGVASLGWSEFQTGHDPTAAYFSPLSRFWELAAGGLLSVWERQRVKPLAEPSQLMPSLLSVLGAVLVLVSGWALSEASAFPGVHALPVVLGSVMIIGAGPLALANRFILSSGVMVQLGLLSYGFYLWHWPVLSFMEIGLGRLPPWTWRTGAVLMALGLAWLSHRFFEPLVRFGPRRPGVVWMLLGMTVVTALGWSAFKRHGMPFRLVNKLNPAASTMTIGKGFELADLSCSGYPEWRPVPAVCWADRRERPVFAVWGDSKSDSLFWGLLRTSHPGRRWVAFGRGVPVVGKEPIYANHQPVSALALQTILAHPEIRLVALTTAMRVLFQLPPGSDERLPLPDLWPRQHGVWALNGLSRTVDALEGAGKKVVFVIDNPTLPEPRKCLPGGRALGLPVSLGGTRWPENMDCGFALAQHLVLTRRYREMVSELARRHPRMVVFDPTAILCPDGVCAASQDGQFMYWRSDHISDTANEQLGRVLNEQVARF